MRVIDIKQNGLEVPTVKEFKINQEKQRKKIEDIIKVKSKETKLMFRETMEQVI